MRMLAGGVKLLRPHQWLKNLLLFFPAFLSGALSTPKQAMVGIPAFVVFCFASSSGYILNDIIDLQYDLLHPRKKNRPLPAGLLTLKAAAAFAVLLSGVAIGVAFVSLSSRFLLLLLLYLLVTAIYSFKVKDVALMDVFCIATGFILRLEAGGEAFSITISDWLFLTVFLLALFLSIGKRLTEQRNLGLEAEFHRKSLAGYPDGFLDGSMYLTGAAVLVTYSMYTITRGQMLYTVPLCCFGLLRYILRVKSGLSGDPTESLLKDPVLFCVGIFWIGCIYWDVYGYVGA